MRTRIGRRGAGALLLAFGAGCAAGGGAGGGAERNAADDVGPALPGAWAADVPAGPLSHERWWLSFGDSRLDALVSEAWEHNHDLVAAARRVEVALAGIRGAGAARVPGVDLQGGFQRRRQNFVGLPIPGGVLTTTSTQWDPALAVAWEADLWGRLAAGERAARADAAARAAELAAAYESLAARTAGAWVALREASAQVDLARAILASQRESERAVEQRVRAGLARPLDLRLVRTDTRTAGAGLATRELALEDASRALEVLLGRYPRAEIAAPATLADAPPPVPVGLPIELLARRPDLVAAQRAVDAAGARTDAARAERWPRVTLTGALGRTSDELADLLDGDFSVWGLAARLAAPLFDGGRRRAEVAAADARRREAEATFAGAVLVACSEVEGALGAERTLTRREAELAAGGAEAEAAARLARDEYARGTAGILVLLAAQRAELALSSQHLSVRAARLTARIDLHLALGGGFPNERQPDPRQEEGELP